MPNTSAMYDPVFHKIRQYTMLVGEGAFDIGVNLIVMILVQRSLGVGGLGIFSYLLSLLMFAAFISEFGISNYLEREIAITPGKKAQEQVIEDAVRATLATSLICGMVFFAFAVSSISLTRVDERAAGYIIIAFTIAVRNFNALKIAVLQGRGEYGTAATLKTFKRLLLLGAVFVCLQWGFVPSYLMLGYLAAEVGLAVKSVKKVRLPKSGRLFKEYPRLRTTLEESFGFILTDDALDVIFYMDFLILGIFVTSRDLGVYAQASILARMFLLIPTSIKPVFLGRYCALASQNRLPNAAGSFKISAAFLFFLHSVLALYILLFYSDIMRSLFHARGVDMTSFYIFAEILPGLLFFSAVTSQEPVYEADGKAGALQKMIIMIAVVNLCLNLFFVPFAGFFGAAFATAASMFVYFMLFGRYLSPEFTIHKTGYLFAGAAVYLTFMFFETLDMAFALTLVTVPAFLFGLFTLMGFFNVMPESDQRPAEMFRLVWKQPETGGFDDGRQ